MAKKQKKILLFIVEGPTDEISLGLILSKLFDNEDVKFKVVRGDITSDRGSNSQNIIKKVNKQIKAFLDNNHFTKKNIKKVIHLVDIDGVYIDDADVIENKQIDGILYFEDHMEAPDRKCAIERNKQKKLLLNKLCTTTEISKIDYKMYFFCCNLEHVLHNNQNADDDSKRDLALSFSDMYAENPNEFITFINSSEFKAEGDYAETWEVLKKDKNSLSRLSNFHLLFGEDKMDNDKD